MVLRLTVDNIMAKRVNSVTLAEILPLVQFILSSMTERTKQVREPRLVTPHMGADHPDTTIRALCWTLACVQDCCVYTTLQGVETQPGLPGAALRHLFGDSKTEGDRWWDRFIAVQGSNVVLRSQPLFGRVDADGSPKASGSIVKFADQINDNGGKLASMIRDLAKSM